MRQGIFYFLVASYFTLNPRGVLSMDGCERKRKKKNLENN